MFGFLRIYLVFVAVNKRNSKITKIDSIVDRTKVKMPINFPLLGFDSTAPGDAYLAKLLENSRQQQALRADRTQNKYLGPGLAQALQKVFLENQKSQAESPYWGPKAAADLATQQAEPGLKIAQMKEALARVPWLGAQTNEMNINNQTLGEKNKLSLEEQRLKNIFFPRVTESEINERNANANFKNSGGGIGGMGGVGIKELGALEGQIKKDNPGMSDQDANYYAGELLNGNADLLNQKNVKISGISSNLLDQITRRSYGSNATNQMRYEKTTEALLDKGEEYLNSGAADYAGVGGKLKLLGDAAAAQFGHVSPRYENYMNFVTTVGIPAAGEMLRALGGNATDTQKKMYGELSNPLYWNSNPNIAISQYKALKDLFKNTIGKTISKSPHEIKDELQGNPSGKGIPVDPNQKILVVGPDGTQGRIPAQKLDVFIKNGYKRIG